MFSFKRNPPSSPSSSSNRPALLPPRPSYAHSPDSRSGSPTSSHRETFGFGFGSRSPLASPALSLSNRGGGDGYFNLPLPLPTPHFPGLDGQTNNREWSEESLALLRSSVVEDIKKVDDILRLFKVQKEIVGALVGVHKDLGTGLKRLGIGEGLGVAIPSALTPCSQTSTDLSQVLHRSLKSTSKEIDRMEGVLYRHSRAVKKEYNALDEVILINDKRMAAAEKPLQTDSRSSAVGKGGIGGAHERYLRVISGLCDDSAHKKRSTAESISAQHGLAMSRLTASICQTYHILFEALAEGMRAGAGKIGGIRYAGILVAENWEGELPGQGNVGVFEDGDNGGEILGEETIRWRRPDGSGERAQSPAHRIVSDRDRPKPIGKRSMPVPPTTRTPSYPSTIGTTSVLSSSTTTTTNSLSPHTPTDQDRPPGDFDPMPGYYPSSGSSTGMLRQPVSANSARISGREERKGHRPSASVSDRMKQFENGTIGSHTSQASSVSSNRSDMSRQANTRPYSLPAVAPLRLPSRETIPTKDNQPKEREREVPRDYSRLPVPASPSTAVSSSKGSSDRAGERVRRLSGLFERKNDTGESGSGPHVQRITPSPQSRHGAGCMCPNCYVAAGTAKVSTIRPVMPHSPSLRPGLPASRQSTSSIHSFSDVEVRHPSPKRLSQKVDHELAKLLDVETARGGR